MSRKRNSAINQEKLYKEMMGEQINEKEYYNKQDLEVDFGDIPDGELKEDEEINKLQLKKIKSEIAKILNNDIKLKAKNESQKKLIESIKHNEIVFCEGNAGVGKTYIAVAYALNLIRKSSTPYVKIYLVKPAITLPGEDMGYLKGSLSDKYDVYMTSFYLNIEKLIGKSTMNELLEKQIIQPLPLAYLRGASLDSCIICADEIQNVSYSNSKTLLTRIGFNSKMIVLGDSGQIDLKDKTESALAKLVQMFKGCEDEGIGVVEMSDEDENVRNPIINVIERKFKEQYNIFENKSNNKHNMKKKSE